MYILIVNIVSWIILKQQFKIMLFANVMQVVPQPGTGACYEIYFQYIVRKNNP